MEFENRVVVCLLLFSAALLSFSVLLSYGYVP